MRKAFIVCAASVVILVGVLFAQKAGAGDLNDQICAKDIPDPPEKPTAGDGRLLFASTPVCARMVNDKYLARGWRVVTVEGTPGGVGWLIAVEKR